MRGSPTEVSGKKFGWPQTASSEEIQSIFRELGPQGTWSKPGHLIESHPSLPLVESPRARLASALHMHLLTGSRRSLCSNFQCYLHLNDVKIEQRDDITCPESHGLYLAKSGIQILSIDSLHEGVDSLNNPWERR